MAVLDEEAVAAIAGVIAETEYARECVLRAAGSWPSATRFSVTTTTGETLWIISDGELTELGQAVHQWLLANSPYWD
jgi:hypothetical protein